jgi:hypothetical protein
MRSYAALATIAGLAVCESLGGTAGEIVGERATEMKETGWEFSFSTVTYLAQHARDFANPNFIADRDWLHVELRYNYESIKTGSVWLGYNFSFGDKLLLEVTPMLGGVFGDITGVAPGYAISLSYWALELSTQGEYFIDAGTHAGNFFYTWTELSCALTSWLKGGIVIDRTKVLGENFDIRRGPLVGFKYKQVDLTTYWLSPGSRESTFIFAVTVNF